MKTSQDFAFWVYFFIARLRVCAEDYSVSPVGVRGVGRSGGFCSRGFACADRAPTIGGTASRSYASFYISPRTGSRYAAALSRCAERKPGHLIGFAWEEKGDDSNRLSCYPEIR